MSDIIRATVLFGLYGAALQGLTTVNYQLYYDAVAAGDVKQVLAAAAVCGPLGDQSPGLFAMEQAVRSGRWDLVAAFLDSGTNIDVRNHGEESTPLMWAADEGHDQLVGRLLEARANLEASDRSGGTALFHAAAGQHAAVVRLLLAAGANAHHRDVQGRLAADVAKYRHFRWAFLGVGGKYRTLVDTESRKILRAATRSGSK